MPDRCRPTLMAGITALLGLCICGTGCHSNLIVPPPPVADESSPVRQTQYAIPPVSTTSPPTIQPPSKPLAQMGRPKRKPLFGGSREDASSAPTADMLKPVPNAPGAVVASHETVGSPVFAPAHRVMPVGPPARIERPTAVGIPVELTPPIAGTPDKDPASKETELKIAPRPMPVSKPVIHPDIPTGPLVHALDAPGEFKLRALSAYIIEPPDVLAIELTPRLNERQMPISGPHLVRPDGTVGLGAVGSVFVAGLTLDMAKARVADAIYRFRQATLTEEEKKDGKGLKLEDINANLKVDVQAYNSKFYYVITDGGGYGAQVAKVPFTGKEMVLDAIAQVQGLPAVSSPKKIWIARASKHGGNILPVDWRGIAMAGSAETNYQLFPGDRLFVHSDPRIRVDSNIAKIISPIERILGVTLLGSSTVNSIRNRNNFNNTGF